jgi:hypothetical protein
MAVQDIVQRHLGTLQATAALIGRTLEEADRDFA